ncbi:transport ATPase 3 (substrates copper/metal cation) [Halalkalicoccus jeotgali B3]|uniref:Transport ATPase 3 (Substrates copper/metal cation) n=1 Tax=Halalkalicoccus jeotgali (strain DSM 18796 / CECT 7217 / JCM 14584 / KCTC 4019 / B3) TaxID=795797 RepID=D8JCK7_HALJB|nr:transport ATPase 3 (substrates copper/metal cation) [Halalkalicoccus jeotgali B3]ELY41731.1 transport ATPase 3 (substrates copper/metal cation) [Halalkalicoccus jeotgali B3]
MAGVSVLVVSCPCSLGIATPLALAAATRDVTDNRILVLNETVLERIDDSSVVVFDKTGTLTTGAMELVDVVGDDPDEVLAVAAAVERQSSHPIAAAIDDAAPLTTRSVLSFERADRTMSALVDDTRVIIGHPDSFDADEWTIPAEIEAAVTDAYESCTHPTAVAWEGVVRGIVTVRDTPRENWERVVSDLADADREIVVLTGDDERMTETFANHPAVDHVFADVRPESKEVIVQGLRERGTTTMIGDGTNDAPALASADLGIAVSSGTDLAIEAADAVVLDDRLDAVPEVFELASETRDRIKQNLVWAAGYNTIALPLAMAGVITPLIAAVMMAISSLIVVFNSKRRLFSANGDQVTATDSSEGNDQLGSPAHSD